MKQWWLYIIKTQKGKLYTGITVDLMHRFLQHYSGIGGAKFFRSDLPDTIIYVEKCSGRSDASIKEAYIKKLNRKNKEKYIKGELDE